MSTSYEGSFLDDVLANAGKTVPTYASVSGRITDLIVAAMSQGDVLYCRRSWNVLTFFISFPMGNISIPIGSLIFPERVFSYVWGSGERTFPGSFRSPLIIDARIGNGLPKSDAFEILRNIN